MKKITLISVLISTMALISCKKDKNPNPPSEEPKDLLPPEVITTLRYYIWDSSSNLAVAGSPFTFKDADGEGGQPGTFLNGGADSLIKLLPGSTYYTRLVILDETKNPVDSVSNAIAIDESYEHMVFYNGNPADQQTNKGNMIMNSNSSQYIVKLNGSNILVRYTDLDNGSAHDQPTRPIGLTTVLKTSSATASSYPFIISLRHQPAAKDGTYNPGETDVEVGFRIRVQ